MADDVTLNSMSGGPVVATDDSGTGHVQIVKLAQSGDGSRSPITADANGLAVVTTPGTVIASKTTVVHASGMQQVDDSPTGLPSGFEGAEFCMSRDGRIQYVTNSGDSATVTSAYKSVDYGFSWSATGSFPSGITTHSAACSDDGQFVVFTGSAGSFESVDGGATWRTSAGTYGCASLSADGRVCAVPLVNGNLWVNNNYLDPSSWNQVPGPNAFPIPYVGGFSAQSLVTPSGNAIVWIDNSGYVNLTKNGKSTVLIEAMPIDTSSYVSIALSNDTLSLYVSSASSPLGHVGISLIRRPLAGSVISNSAATVFYNYNELSRRRSKLYPSANNVYLVCSGDGTSFAYKNGTSASVSLFDGIGQDIVSDAPTQTWANTGGPPKAYGIRMDESGSTIYQPPYNGTRRRFTRTTRFGLLPSVDAGKRKSVTISNPSSLGLWVSSDVRVGSGSGIYIPPMSSAVLDAAPSVTQLYGAVESTMFSDVDKSVVVSATVEAFA